MVNGMMWIFPKHKHKNNNCLVILWPQFQSVSLFTIWEVMSIRACRVCAHANSRNVKTLCPQLYYTIILLFINDYWHFIRQSLLKLWMLLYSIPPPASETNTSQPHPQTFSIMSEGPGVNRHPLTPIYTG